MQLELKSWGNSVGIIIPKSLLSAAKMSRGDRLEARLENGALILEKSFRHRTLEERIEESGKPLELSGEIDFGESRGREIW